MRKVGLTVAGRKDGEATGHGEARVGSRLTTERGARPEPAPPDRHRRQRTRHAAKPRPRMRPPGA